MNSKITNFGVKIGKIVEHRIDWPPEYFINALACNVVGNIMDLITGVG